jgi:hypothetical protein
VRAAKVPPFLSSDNGGRLIGEMYGRISGIEVRDDGDGDGDSCDAGGGGEEEDKDFGGGEGEGERMRLVVRKRVLRRV